MKILNSGFYGMLETSTNYFLLNLIWVIFSLPLFTIFPATAAMFAILRDWRMENRPNMLSSFTRYFKMYFKQSFIISLGFFIGACILLADFFLLNDLNTPMFFLVTLTIFTIGAIILFISIYLFPTIVHFQLTNKQIIKTSFMFSFKYIPWTIISTILLFTMGFLVFSVPILSLIIFSLTAQLIYIICYRNFTKSGLLQEKAL